MLCSSRFPVLRDPPFVHGGSPTCPNPSVCGAAAWVASPFVSVAADTGSITVKGVRSAGRLGASRDEALPLAAKINAELAEGARTLLSFRLLPLSDLAGKWIDQHERVRRSSIATVRRYRTAVRHLTR